MPKNRFLCDCLPVDIELVTSIKSNMAEEDAVLALSDLFSVIGDSTRCKILFALRQNPMCVCDLANVLSMTKSSISHQLNKMKTTGLVKCSRSGKHIFYSLDDKHIFDILDTAINHISHKAQETDNEQ